MEASDILAIQQLNARYGQFVDDHRFEELGDLFCADGVWEAGPLRFSGRAEVVAGFPGIEPPQPGMVKHLTFPAVVEGEGDEARVWADAIALTVGAPGEPCPVVAAGRYHDVLRREQGQWRFAHRVFVYSGQPVPDGLSAAPALPVSA
ncbi:MAG: nuclear transport factor 2 family protein [Novosphingobium sp.]|nr:nuclear transport factor 2 family protein [Novosphingobium sp.]